MINTYAPWIVALFFAVLFIIERNRNVKVEDKKDTITRDCMNRLQSRDFHDYAAHLPVFEPREPGPKPKPKKIEVPDIPVDMDSKIIEAQADFIKLTGG